MKWLTIDKLLQDSWISLKKGDFGQVFVVCDRNIMLPDDTLNLDELNEDDEDENGVDGARVDEGNGMLP
ncbi:hypothetical protein L1049_014432 [Liquidambar formosana]|uniref:Uncharacterized protein n=1 Tax=Liquidambar formosana TaxID=63359 RepID=A0AAP0RVS3_LIQFO